MDETLREQNDRIAITDVINRYGTTIDAGDYEGLASCFSPDAVVRYGGGREFRGGEAVAEFVKGATVELVAQQHLLCSGTTRSRSMATGPRPRPTSMRHRSRGKRREAG